LSELPYTGGILKTDQNNPVNRDSEPRSNLPGGGDIRG